MAHLKGAGHVWDMRKVEGDKVEVWYGLGASLGWGIMGHGGLRALLYRVEISVSCLCGGVGHASLRHETLLGAHGMHGPVPRLGR